MPQENEKGKGMRQKISRAIFWLLFAFCVISLIVEFKKTCGERCAAPGREPASITERAK
jgi:preprotein translocase subunit SecG